jgi:hypothetical protein
MDSRRFGFLAAAMISRPAAIGISGAMRSFADTVVIMFSWFGYAHFFHHEGHEEHEERLENLV